MKKKMYLVSVFVVIAAIISIIWIFSPGVSYALNNQDFIDNGGSSHTYVADLQNVTNKPMSYTIRITVYGPNGLELAKNHASYTLEKGEIAEVEIDFSFFSDEYSVSLVVDSVELG